MKNNKYLLLVLLATVGCSKSKDYPTLLSELEKRSTSDEQFVRREVAADPAELCMKDKFSTDSLKAEVREIEKKFKSGTKVTGKWKHLNLEDLPIPQANFLKRFGNSLGDMNNPDAFDYSGCQDVPCIFNTIYGKPNNPAGYVHYLWYLRMGHLLGASNKVNGALAPATPGLYNEKTFPVSAYLYREKEIYAFWRMMKILKAPHTTLTDLNEIHRVPQGESFDTEMVKRKNGNASFGEVCGRAFSNGFIVLQDLCLGVSSDWDSGDFYSLVLHEISHHVDFHQGRSKGEAYRSDDQDYLDLSKFQLNEYKDETGKTIRQWQHKPGIKLVSSYAGTSPAENFADTLALFRVDGTTTKSSISTEHWDFTSKNYYFDKNFEKKYLINGWLESEGSLLSQLVFKAVGECSASTKPTASTYFKKTDFSVVVLPSMVNCLGTKAVDISRQMRIKIKGSDLDGCKVLTDYNIKSDWEPALKPAITQLANKYLKELQADKEYFARAQKFIDNISKRDFANEAFLGCLDKETEESCYEESVLRLARANLAQLSLPETQAQDLAELYFDAHPLSDTKAYLTGYYRSFVSSHLEQIQQDAGELYAKCEAMPLNDDAPPSGKHFSIVDGYMVSSIYNCLNSHFPDTAKLIVRGLAVGEMTVQHPKEEVIMYEQVVPELKKSLETIYLKKKEAEVKALATYIANDQGKIRKSIISDFKWVRDVLKDENVVKECRKSALALIDFPLSYQTKGAAFGALADASCSGIAESPEYKKWLDDSKSEFANRSVSGLESKIIELAQLKAKSCLVQFPVDTSLNRIKFKKDREACLISEWTVIEGEALKQFESDPMVVKFKIDVAAVKTQLDLNRRRLQIRMIKENF